MYLLNAIDLVSKNSPLLIYPGIRKIKANEKVLKIPARHNFLKKNNPRALLSLRLIRMVMKGIEKLAGLR